MSLGTVKMLALFFLIIIRVTSQVSATQRERFRLFRAARSNATTLFIFFFVNTAYSPTTKRSSTECAFLCAVHSEFIH